MSALTLKLWRDLLHIWPQALAISLVMAAGVATLILAQGAYRSLFETREAYYERYRFADVFANAKRAPETLMSEVSAIEGVAFAEGRVRGGAILDMPGMIEPASAQMLSLPLGDAPSLNALFVRKGTLPQAHARDDIAISNAFAVAHSLDIGDSLKAVIGGNARDLRITAIVDSPEFIYTLSLGELMPDDRRTAVIWMPRRELSAALDLDGAFNDMSIKLLRNASQAEVISRLDVILKPYGGRGGYGRKDHLSHAFVDAELTQLQAMAVVMPPIFLAVAAFLINMTLARMIAMEREQIGLLKALGYSNAVVAAHYIKFALIISGVGFVIGVGGGWWLGRGLTRMFGEFYKFPFLYFTQSSQPYLFSGIVALLAGGLAAAFAVRKVVELAPAVAMQPPTPQRFSHVLQGAGRVLPQVSQLTMMIIRQLLRWPLRAAITVVGMSLSVAILLSALFSFDSVEYLIDVTFFQAERQDATITFTDPRPLSVIDSVAALPGVEVVEPVRSVSVRLRNGNFHRRIGLLGKTAGADLNRTLDRDLNVVRPDTGGIIISSKLAEILHLSPGARVEVEMLEGRGLKFSLPVVDINTGYIGLGALMEFNALNDLLLDGPLVSSVNFSFDQAREREVYAAIKNVPSLSGLALQKQSLSVFRKTIGENITVMSTVYFLLAGLIAFGVVYNTARIRLSERGRELASLRVIGFTRGEVYWVLFGEFVVLVLASVPVGWLLGYGLAYSVAQGLQSELYQVPLIIFPATYAKASLVVLVSAAISAILIRMRIDSLDLIAVLKTRE